MRVIVVGAGEVGYHVADRVSQEQHDVVVIDLDADRLEYVQSHLDVAVIKGNGASPAVLRQAKIGETELLIAVSSVDEVNLVSCMGARGFPGLLKIARVSNPDFYKDESRLHPELFGVDVMVNPERELALETFRLLQSTAATDIAVFAGGSVQLVGLVIQEDAPIAGRKLADIGSEVGRSSMLTAAVKRDGKTVVPRGSMELRGGDHIYVVVRPDGVPKALELCGYKPVKLKRVMIAGGSLEAFYFAELLQQHSVECTLIVKEKRRAQELAEMLNQALILNGDATDVELLELEGVGGVDAFVALTDNDESNILAAQVAKDIGAKQVVTLVNQIEYVPLARRIGLDAAVSPRLSAANAILQYVRRGNVTRVATLKDTDAEAISFQVTANAPVVGKSIADVDFPEGSIVAAIVRDTEVIIPRGEDVFAAGDAAIVFALPEAVKKVSELFPE